MDIRRDKGGGRKSKEEVAGEWSSSQSFVLEEEKEMTLRLSCQCGVRCTRHHPIWDFSL